MDVKLGVEVHKSIVELKEAMNNLLSIVSSVPTVASTSACVIRSCIKVCFLCLLPCSVQSPTFL